MSKNSADSWDQSTFIIVFFPRLPQFSNLCTSSVKLTPHLKLSPGTQMRIPPSPTPKTWSSQLHCFTTLFSKHRYVLSAVLVNMVLACLWSNFDVVHGSPCHSFLSTSPTLSPPTEHLTGNCWLHTWQSKNSKPSSKAGHAY